jgi:hypothetical protein
METLAEEQAIKIDKILKLLINQKAMRIDEICDKINIELTEAEFLIKVICDLQFEGDNIVESIGNNTYGILKIKAKYNTEKFIKVGGYLKWRNDQIEFHKKETEQKELELTKLKNDLESFKITKKQYCWNLSLAIMGIIIALISIFIQVFEKYQ